MFLKLYSVSALFVLSLLTAIKQGHSYSLPMKVLEYDSCEDVNSFLIRIYSLSPVEAFKAITVPLDCPACSLEEKSFRNRIIGLVTSGAINMRSILQQIVKGKSLNRDDILITTLMAINEYTDLDASIKADISNAVLYLLKKRYLGVSDFSNARYGFCGNGLYLTPSGSGPGFSTYPDFGGSVRVPITPTLIRPNPYPGRTIGKPWLFGTVPSTQVPGSYIPWKQPEPVITAYPTWKPPNGNAYSPPGIGIGYNPFPKPPSTPSNECVCQSNALETLLKKIFSLANSPTSSPCGIKIDWSTIRLAMQQLEKYIYYLYLSAQEPNGIGPGTPSRPPPSITIIPPPTSPTPFFPDVFRPTSSGPIGSSNVPDILLRLIPPPQYAIEQEMYRKFLDMLKNPQIRSILESLDLSKYTTDSEKFDMIMTTLIEVVRTEEHREIINFFINHKEAARANFNFAVFIAEIPRPVSINEKHYYDIIKSFLESKLPYQLSLPSDFYQTKTLREKLLIFFSEILRIKVVSLDVLEAVKYYLNILNGKSLNFPIDAIIQLIPVPTTDNEKLKYDIIKAFLIDNNLYALLQNVSLTNMTADQILTYILHGLISSPDYRDVSEIAIYYRNLLAKKKFGFDYFTLVETLNTSPDIEVYIVPLREYLYTYEFESILSKLSISSTLSDIEKLKLILEAIKTESSDVNITKAATALLLKLQVQLFYVSMSKIVQMIPTPKNDKEKAMYAIVTSFLLTEPAYRLLNYIDANIFPDNKLLLDFIFKMVVESNNIKEYIRNAFEYYRDLTEQLRPIEFITKMEITKRFKLTEIFTDTLDLKSLTLYQKDAFKRFFKYISEIKQDALSGFNSWNEAKTRGEFMKLLFHYMITSSTTPSEIKEAILILNPLVRMDGKGSIPP